jgi:uncharacterized protein YbjT (DUF2867 family)
VKVIAHGAADGEAVRLPSALMQPIVSDDVAALLADIAVGAPVGGTVEIAGPEPIRQDEMIRQFFRATGDTRSVVVDPAALYFGVRLDDQSLTPGANARLGKTRFQDWLKQSVRAA